MGVSTQVPNLGKSLASAMEDLDNLLPNAIEGSDKSFANTMEDLKNSLTDTIDQLRIMSGSQTYV